VEDLYFKQALDPDSKGDIVYKNALSFLRNALISREFSDMVKAGDSGRVFLVLKTWALSYRGNERVKYVYEMLNMIHNIINRDLAKSHEMISWPDLACQSPWLSDFVA
jgi:hypothetical protein